MQSLSYSIRLILIVLALVLVSGGPTKASAQQTNVPSFPSALLPGDHWSFRAVRRLEALGLTDPGHSWGDMTMTRREAGSILDRAVALAERERPELLPVVRGYRDRFAEEFPGTMAALRGETSSGARFLDGSSTLGYDDHRGGILVGSGYRNATTWSGPRPIGHESGAAGDISLGAALFPYLAADVTAIAGPDDVEVATGYIMGGWRSAIIWFGRHIPAFGQSEHGGIVLSGTNSFDGGGLFLDDPIELPGPLRWLGPVRFSTFLSRMDENRYELPWIWGARGSFQPHPRLTLGANRAVIFGGKGNGAVNVRNITYIVIGKHAGNGSEFDNQVVSFDLRYRPPLESLPLAVYVEWGLEDSAGAWKDVPGVVAGVEVPALPGLPAVGLGVERASFAPSCCGNPIWYRHWSFTDGWADDGVLLGHPLGGHGREWLAYANADLFDSRLRLLTRVFTRDRGEENVYAPTREGESVGGMVRLEFRPMRHAEVVFQGATERGSEGSEGRWRETRAYTGVRILF